MKCTVGDVRVVTDKLLVDLKDGLILVFANDEYDPGSAFEGTRLLFVSLPLQCWIIIVVDAFNDAPNRNIISILKLDDDTARG